MKLLHTLLASSLISACLISTTQAQTHYDEFLERASAQQLNTSVITFPAADPSGDLQMLMGLPANTINIDSNALFNLPDFKIEIPGLENIYAVSERTFANTLGGENWVGDLVYLDPTGFNTGIQGRAYFVENENGITGTIITQDEVIQIYPDSAGGQVMVRQAPSAFEKEGEILPGNSGIENEIAASPAVAGRRDGPNVATMENPYIIDVLWVTTTDARASGDDMAALVETATLQSNDVMRNSGIPALFRSVGIHDDTEYTETLNDGGQTLVDIQRANDGHMDYIHALREQHGADMVHVVSAATNVCGIAWLDAEYDWAFAVTNRGCMTGLYVPMHEMGHNFGAHHDKFQGGADNGNYQFGYGTFNDTNAPYWRTVMSYSCTSGNSCPTIPYFSSPDLSYEGMAIGSEEEHNNARLMRVRVAEVSGFNPAAAGCTEHTATNSTHVNEGRAYSQTELWTTTYYAVGSDEQLSGYSFSSSTLAEQPTGYFTLSTCDALPPINTETAFAPELQNFVLTQSDNNIQIQGEVFDANSDVISSVQARLNGSSSWINASVSGQTFSVNIPVTESGDIDFDFRTQDVTGESFEFTTTFELESTGGEPPVIELNGVNVSDSQIYFYGSWSDPENDVSEIRYQFNGAGNPASGSWSIASDTDTYFNNIIESGLAAGNHTIHVIAVDSAGNFSNVENATFEIIVPTAPECIHFTATPATSTTAGEIDLSAIVNDVNASGVSVQYRVNGSAWTEIESIARLDYRRLLNFRLPTIYTEGTNLTIEMRAVDSTNLTTNCPSQSYQVNYPNNDEAPTCEIVELYREGPVIHYLQSSTDPNGDLSSMAVRWAGIQTQWWNSWPGIISGNSLPVPGVGEFTLEARTVDATGLEGSCSATITIADTSATPSVNWASAYWDNEWNAVRAYADPRDEDGDIAIVEIRAVGSGTWLNLSSAGYGQDWEINLGQLANGDYEYEVRATDGGGRVSDIYTFDFTIAQESAPLITNVDTSRFRRDFTISGSINDADDNADRIYYSLEGGTFEYTQVTGNTWSLPTFINLADGTYTVDIYASDTSGLNSATETITLEVDGGTAPIVDNVALTVNDANGSADVSVTASDTDNDIVVVQFVIDGTSVVRLPLAGNNLTTTLTNLAPGTHTLDVTVEDSYGNISTIDTTTFDVVETTACFTDTNSNHETANRATSTEECSFSFGGTCYGTITTNWYAVGSNNNLGTNASATTSLLESSPGYFEEVAACEDNDAPVITLIGDNPMTVYQGQAYVEPGATATDNIDGAFNVSNITGTVNTSIVASYTVTYNATDSSGNNATPVVRTVNVVADDVKPVITIATGTSYSVNMNNSFTNPVPTATDNVDGDISSNVVITGSVNTTTAGTYYLYYNVSDAANNTADEIVVTVEVIDQPTTQCFTSSLSEHTSAGRVYEQYYSYYSTGTATFLGSTFNDANKIVSLEEISPGNWSEVSTCN
ncbi:MAG: DUF5011 domain-containing protein [Agarilytica sp.]